jgi:DNA-binding LacI/PurR family transcriptional regulator
MESGELPSTVRPAGPSGAAAEAIPPSRPTLADVAAAAGVSRTTASNAYNRPDQLSAQQRARVLAVASELGYPGPDPVARSLRTRSAGAVGLIFSAQLSQAFSDPAAVEFLHGVAQACEERDRSLLLVPAAPNATNTAMVARASVDGFLISSMPDDDPHVEVVLARPQAAVVIDAPTTIDSADFVGIEDRSGFAAVARHVLGLGHRHLAVLSMSADAGSVVEPVDDDGWPSDRHAVPRERLLGLRDAVDQHRAAGGPPVRVVVRPTRLNSVDVGREVAAELLGGATVPTAIMCTSDALAFGVLAELAERGIDVPAEITVTGFDDVPGALERGLTTVNQPTHEKGYVAAGLLLDRAMNVSELPPERIRRILPTRLVVRDTSGPVADPR